MHDIDVANQRISEFTSSYVTWKTPEESKVKINFNGAYRRESYLSASRVIVRNSGGEILCSRSTLHQGVSSAFAAEALACLAAMEMGKDMGWRDIIVECDSLTVIKKRKEITLDGSEIGAHIAKIMRIYE